MEIERLSMYRDAFWLREVRVCSVRYFILQKKNTSTISYSSSETSGCIPCIQMCIGNAGFRQHTDKPLGISNNQIAALWLYTVQWPPSVDSLHIVINRALFAEDRSLLWPWRQYLRLFLTGLFQLPRYTGHVYRGVCQNLLASYKALCVCRGIGGIAPFCWSQTTTVVEGFFFILRLVLSEST